MRSNHPNAASADAASADAAGANTARADVASGGAGHADGAHVSSDRPLLEFSLRLQRDSFCLRAAIPPLRGLLRLSGEVGAGKSTLLHCLAGIAPPQEGFIRLADSILLDSSRNVSVPAHRRPIASLFQEDRLFPHLNADKNIRYGYRRSGLPGLKLEEVLDLLELPPLLGRYPGELSGGERKRVAWARTLLSGYRLLLLDEPFTALSKRYIEALKNYLLQIDTITVILVSHSFGELFSPEEHKLRLEQGSLSIR